LGSTQKLFKVIHKTNSLHDTEHVILYIKSSARTHLIPILAKTSSHWKDFPCPLPPQIPRMRGTYKRIWKKKNEWSLDKSSSAIYYGENMFVVACLDVGQGHEVLGDVNN